MPDASWSLVRFVTTALVLGPPVAIYVYRDRTRRGKPRPLAWALGLGILGLPGLCVHLYLRGDFGFGAKRDDEVTDNEPD
ncbi:hypothetical protein [Halorussus pelagicus]|uniref:hypothetical protein n=1 Tax=Halorussus pelagicus TaxID=2505977 RepID=UPI000FFBF460|nr:hypothetical protein [Halorussus pelagicus]